MLRLAALLVFLVTPALARDHLVRFTQEDCVDAAAWELWGSRNGADAAPVAIIPATTVVCPPGDLDPIEAHIDVKLRNGTWNFTLRVFDPAGVASEFSDPVEVRLPMPKPKLHGVERK